MRKFYEIVVEEIDKPDLISAPPFFLVLGLGATDPTSRQRSSESEHS